MSFFKWNKTIKISKHEQVFCTKIIEFDAGHRVFDADSEKCEKLHGHHYKTEITFAADRLNNGVVIDFNLIKERVKQWIDKNWDHNVILSHRDSKLASEINNITGQNVFLLENNATTELMAMYLLNICNQTLFEDIEDVICVSVKIWETPTAFAEYNIYK